RTSSPMPRCARPTSVTDPAPPGAPRAVPPPLRSPPHREIGKAMSPKRLRAAALGGVATLTLVAACSSDNGSSDNGSSGGNEEITLAVALPTTGGSPVLGEPMSHGIELAVEDINEAGGVDGRTIATVNV